MQDIFGLRVLTRLVNTFEGSSEITDHNFRGTI